MGMWGGLVPVLSIYNQLITAGDEKLKLYSCHASICIGCQKNIKYLAAQQRACFSNCLCGRRKKCFNWMKMFLSVLLL